MKKEQEEKVLDFSFMIDSNLMFLKKNIIELNKGCLLHKDLCKADYEKLRRKPLDSVLEIRLSKIQEKDRILDYINTYINNKIMIALNYASFIITSFLYNNKDMFNSKEDIKDFINLFNKTCETITIKESNQTKDCINILLNGKSWDQVPCQTSIVRFDFYNELLNNKETHPQTEAEEKVLNKYIDMLIQEQENHLSFISLYRELEKAQNLINQKNKEIAEVETEIENKYNRLDKYNLFKYIDLR